MSSEEVDQAASAAANTPTSAASQAGVSSLPARKFSPVILTIKRSPTHTVARTSRQLSLTELRTIRGDSDNTFEWNIGWVDKCSPTYFRGLRKTQRVNHVPGIEQVSRKRNLARCLAPLMAAHPDEFDFSPRSWMFPANWEEFQAAFRARRAREQADSTLERMTYIVKPGSGCQGRGIFLTQSLEDTHFPQNGYIAQEYISRPLLIRRKKFDMRIYVAITSVTPLRLYLFQDGLARFCTEDYEQPDAGNLATLFGHLTNFSLNKLNSKFVHASDDGEASAAGSEGSKWTLAALNAYLEAEYSGAAVRRMWRDVQALLIKTIIATLPPMQTCYSALFPGDASGARTFQLLGFDVMLDSQLRPWLIEVNRNPSLRCDSPLDQKIKTMAMGQLFHILDPLTVAANNAHACAISGAAANAPSSAPGCSAGRPLGVAAGDPKLSDADEARLATVSSRAEARGTLTPELAAVWGARRARAELQVRLEHEDRTVAAFLSNAAFLVAAKVKAAAEARAAVAAESSAPAAATVAADAVASLYDYGAQVQAPAGAGAGAGAADDDDDDDDEGGSAGSRKSGPLADIAAAVAEAEAPEGGSGATVATAAPVSAADTVTNVAAGAHKGPLPQIVLDSRGGYPLYPAAWQRLYPIAAFADYPCGAPTDAAARAELTEYATELGVSTADGDRDPRAGTGKETAEEGEAAVCAALSRGVSVFHPQWSGAEARAGDERYAHIIAAAREQSRSWERDAIVDAMSVRMVPGPAARPGARAGAAAARQRVRAPTAGPAGAGSGPGAPLGWGPTHPKP
jgi:tubulin polyglutamylase TTLL6/13